MTRMLWALLLTLAAVLAGCASIPPEAPELSTQLGNRIGAMQRAHESLVQQYFAEKRRKVDEFIEKVYVPQFAENFFAQPNVKETWDEVVRSNVAADRLKFLTLVGPKLQAFINKKRLEFIQPLDDLERTVRDKLKGDYDIMLAINNTLSSFLYSASNVEANRKRYLEMVGIKEEKIQDIIDETDKAVSDLTTKAEKIGQADERVAAFKGQIQDIISKFKK